MYVENVVIIYNVSTLLKKNINIHNFQMGSSKMQTKSQQITTCTNLEVQVQVFIGKQLFMTEEELYLSVLNISAKTWADVQVNILL